VALLGFVLVGYGEGRPQLVNRFVSKELVGVHVGFGGGIGGLGAVILVFLLPVAIGGGRDVVRGGE